MVKERMNAKMKLSQRILGINPSATLAVDAKAKELKQKGQNVISFGAGEPDFVSPPGVLAYARQAIDRGETHYTPVSGIMALRQEICRYYGERFGLTVSPAQVIVGPGAKQCLYETMAAIINPGDEVILLAPTWVSYIEQVHFLDGEVSIVDTEKEGFKLNEGMLRAAINERTVAILLNSPANPSGLVYDRAVLEMVGRLALEFDLWIIWDEIYEQLVYQGTEHLNPLQIMPELAERTILVNGVSKTYAMTGWRIGYIIAPPSAAAKIGDFQSHLSSNPCSIAQWAALGAFKECAEDAARMKTAFQERRALICSLLSQMPGVTFPYPQGAFYVFANIRSHIGKSYLGTTISDDVSFCSLLLEKALVALVPGSAFLAPGYVRISYATSEELIREGMKRLHAFLEKLE